MRESGKDNYDPQHPQLSAVTVKGDADYVVAYGIQAEAVDYTIRYVDTSGNELYVSKTLKGNVGDKPVIAFRYINGYFPQAYNITKPLTDDPDDNVFEFIYQPLTSSEQGSGEGGEGSGSGEDTPAPHGGDDTKPDDGQEGKDEPTPGPGPGSQPGPGPEPSTEPQSSTVPEPSGSSEPEPSGDLPVDPSDVPEIIDPGEAPTTDPDKGIPTAVIVGDGAVAGGGLIGLIIFLIRKKREME